MEATKLYAIISTLWYTMIAFYGKRKKNEEYLVFLGNHLSHHPPSSVLRCPSYCVCDIVYDPFRPLSATSLLREEEKNTATTTTATILFNFDLIVLRLFPFHRFSFQIAQTYKWLCTSNIRKED